MYSVSLLTAGPPPVFVVHLDETVDPNSPRIDEIGLFNEALLLGDLGLSAVDVAGCAFRGVALDRLSVVLSTGIDVEPSDSPIYVDDFEKALEYGGWPKVVLALRWTHLDRTFRKVQASIPERDLAELQQTFPTKIRLADGKNLWLSKLRETTNKVASAYEVDYARWLPGDPKSALAAVLVLVHPKSDGASMVENILRRTITA